MTREIFASREAIRIMAKNRISLREICEIDSAEWIDIPGIKAEKDDMENIELYQEDEDSVEVDELIPLAILEDGDPIGNPVLGDEGVPMYDLTVEEIRVEAKKERDQRYDRENTVQVKLKLNKGTDGPIIHQLALQDNKQGYIKSLIWNDIKKKGLR